MNRTIPKLALLLVLLMSTIGMNANPIDMRTAQEVAVKFMNANTQTPLRGSNDLQLVTTYSISRGDAAFYVFNTSHGFVIVSADDCATPVLGYSDESQFDTEDIPIQLQEYLQDFVEQIQYGIENHLEADEATARQWELVQFIGHLTEQRATTVVEPLLTDTWGQGCYYNAKCPEDPDGSCGHVVTGCVATSFAQIMRYWGYPATGIGSHTYTPPGYPEQTANFGATTYDWANMPDRLSASSSSEQIDAVATLMWHCGVAINMEYGPNGSGASPYFIPSALVNYFGYSNELSIVRKNNYSDEDWLALMKNCLDLSCPIHYSGDDSSDGGGHAFICDGYDSNDFLHFNWGWSGSYNGYYSINAMNPSIFSFTSNNIAIINIHPGCAPGITYQVTATSDPSNGGTISGTGTYDCGDVCTLTATGNGDYSFMYWTENGEQISSEATYSFYAMNDRNLEAHFALPINITTSVHPAEGGTVSGGGVCHYNQQITLTANPNEGYVFYKWTKDGEDFSYISTLNLTVTEAAEYVAYFELKPDGILIGDGTCADGYLPAYYYSSLTQQIYTASEIGEASTEISSISFFNTNYGATRNWNVYMVATDKTSFESPSDWIPVSENDLVFSGNITMATHSWATVYFSTPFLYNGSSNVALIVDDNTANYSNINCRTFGTEESQAIGIYGNYDPYNSSGYTGRLFTTKNQVVLGVPSYDYSITVSVGPEGGGTVSGGGPCYLNQPITLTAVPNEGYIFSNWTKNGTVVSYVSAYQITVTASAEYVAHFELKPEGIVIGDGTFNNTNLPTNLYYSLTEQIYTVSEMGGVATEISSVSFFNTDYSSDTRNWNVYLVHTDKTSFESTSDWIPVSENDLVFSGNVTLAGHGWATVYFVTPFLYNGSSNVALIVDDNTNSRSYLKCRTFATEDNQAIRISGYSSSEYDPYYPDYIGTRMTMKNQVIFGIPSYDFTVTATVGPEGGGTVSGGGLYYHNYPLTLTAIANEGYIFSNWTKNGTVVSYTSSYNLSVTESAEYVAHFELKPEGIVIGDGTYANGYLPIHSFNSLTQQIYTASEMGVASTEIYSVSFFHTDQYTSTPSWDVYMVTTDKTSFESASDWIPVSEGDLVFSGTVTLPAHDWATIYFSTPFLYDGTSNVALIVTDNTDNYPDVKCRTFGTEDNQAILVYSYYPNLDPTNTSNYSGMLLTEKNQVIFRQPKTVTATADPVEGGTISGGGDYAYGLTCTLMATPNAGYYFLDWTEDGEVVSYDATYSFIVDSDRNLVANFVEGESTCTISFDLYGSNNNGWSGNYLVVDYGNGTSEQLTLESGASVSYSREVATGSTIALSWIEGANVYQCSFDIKFDNGVLIYHKSGLSANFQQEIYVNCATATAPRTITVVVDPEEGGTAEGAGTYDAGTIITLTATPNAGYSFIHWKENGTAISSDANYSFIVSSDRNLVAFFSLPLTISVTTNLAAGGTATGAGTFEYGNTCRLVATPNEGYLFLHWSKNGEVVSCNATYSFAVTEDAEIEAVFMHLDGRLIGRGELTTRYLPSYSYSMRSLSQQIYTPEEIGGAGNINTVSYYNAGVTNIRSFDIYMVHTDKLAFDNNTDWITVSEADRVFSGNVVLTKGYWTTIVLDTPFAYNGSSNLAIIVDDNTSNWSSGMACRGFYVQDYQAISVNSYNTNYDPYNPSAYDGTRYSMKNQIIFGITSSSVTQTTELAQGSNWFSTYLDITLEDLQNVLNTALPEATSMTIKSKNSNCRWNGTIWRAANGFTWDVASMYRIEVPEACVLTLMGMPINPAEYPITIAPNTSTWIGFPLSESMTLDEAFPNGFAVSGDVIKGKGGNARFTGGQWRTTGNLNVLEPGKGYIYNSAASGDRTLVFPTGAK